MTVSTVPKIPAQMVRYYTEKYDEETRLSRSLKGHIEYHRMMGLIHEHLIGDRVPSQIVLADIGGGCGIYTRSLLDLTVNASMVDPVQAHVDTARKKRIPAVLADARDLPWKNNAFNAALMAGPLYHLKNARDRRLALAEMRRVTAPGSPVIITALNRYAPLIGSTIGATLVGETPDHYNAVVSVMNDGRADDAEGWIGQAYYHTAAEFQSEAENAGLTDIQLVGVGGPGTWLGVLADRYLGPRGEPEGALNIAIKSARLAEQVPELIVLSSMYAILARTPA